MTDSDQQTELTRLRGANAQLRQEQLDGEVKHKELIVEYDELLNAVSEMLGNEELSEDNAHRARLQELIDRADTYPAWESRRLDHRRGADSGAVRNVLLRRELQLLREAKDAAYSERNRLVAALSRLYPSHLAQHPADPGWDPEWRTIVCIHAPCGQLTWHVHDSEHPLFAHLAQEPGDWDGHTTDEKYARLATLDADAPRHQLGIQFKVECQGGGPEIAKEVCRAIADAIMDTEASLRERGGAQNISREEVETLRSEMLRLDAEVLRRGESGAALTRERDQARETVRSLSQQKTELQDAIASLEAKLHESQLAFRDSERRYAEALAVLEAFPDKWRDDYSDDGEGPAAQLETELARWRR